MDATKIKTAPELITELGNAHDQPSLSQAILDTCNAHDAASQDDWTKMSKMLHDNVSMSKLGLGDFAITGVDESDKSNPQLTMSNKDGSELIAVDGQGRIFALSDLFSPASSDSSDTTTPAATPTTDATTTPAATPTTDATTTPAAAPTTDATTTPAATPSTDATTTSANEDPATGLAPDGSFGPNGRKMQLNSDDTQGVYTVQPGDSLWTIAEDKLGVGGAANDPDFQTRVANLVNQLASDNNISNPDMITPGEQLTFTNLQNSAYNPGTSDASTVSSTTSSVTTSPTDSTVNATTSSTDTTTPSPADTTTSTAATTSDGSVSPVATTPVNPSNMSPDNSTTNSDSASTQTPDTDDSAVSSPSSVAPPLAGQSSASIVSPDYNGVPLPAQDADMMGDTPSS
jgi:hypothetical protein